MSNIANLLKVGGIPDMLGQTINEETRVIEPQSFTQEHCRFNLPTSGLLNQGAYITISLTSCDLSRNLPLFAGITGCIESATLFYENNAIAQTRNVNSYMSLKSWYRVPSKRKQVMNTRVGSFQDFMVETGSNGVQGQYSLDKTINGVDIVTAGNFQIDSAFKLGTTSATTAEYKIFLQDLFPLMSQLQIPLGLLGQFSVVLDFSADREGNRVVSLAGESFVAGNNIVEEKMKLVCDLIYFDDMPDEVPVMEKIQAEMNSGLSLVYTDNVSIKVSNAFPALTVGAGQKVQQETSQILGLNNQVVRKIFAAVTPQPNFVANPQVASNPIAGNFVSEATMSSDETVQLVINNNPVFPSPMALDSQIWNELSQCESGATHNVPSGLSSFSGLTSVVPATLYNADISQNFGNNHSIFGYEFNQLDGVAHYYGINLSKTSENVAGAGTSITAQNPVEWRQTRGRTQQKNGSMDLFIWAEAERIMTMKDGTVIVSGS